MKRVLHILCALLFVLVMSIPVSANPNVILDGNYLTFDVPPTIENNRTLVPFRAIFEALGADVDWDSSFQIVSATKGETSITLQIGNPVAHINNKTILLELSPKIIQNRAMVPIRFVSEGFGADVVWDGITRAIIITQKPPNSIWAQSLTKPRTNESEHFIIYFTDSDKSCIADVAQKLEENYARIINDLQPPQMDKINLIIYPNVNDFHKAIKRPNAPDWSVGMSTGPKDILIVSPLNPGPTHNYDGMLQVAVHEFTHSAAAKINPNLHKQRWLSEGIALYEAKQFRRPPDKYPSLAELNSSQTAIYGVGYVLVEYIVDVWGMESIRELIESQGDIPSVLHISTEEFEKGWHTYVRNKKASNKTDESWLSNRLE